MACKAKKLILYCIRVFKYFLTVKGVSESREVAWGPKDPPPLVYRVNLSTRKCFQSSNNKKMSRDQTYFLAFLNEQLYLSQVADIIRKHIRLSFIQLSTSSDLNSTRCISYCCSGFQLYRHHALPVYWGQGGRLGGRWVKQINIQ